MYRHQSQNNFIMFSIFRRYFTAVRPLLKYKKNFETRGSTCKRHLVGKVPFSKPKDFINRIIDDLVKWYDEIIGMNEVRRAQNRVLEEERNFRNAQEQRKKLLLELNEINRKIKEVYVELDSTDRGEDKYVALVTSEHKLLKEEKAIAEKFALAEENERETFAMLSNSVKFSHEQERVQRERTKYWSLFGSIFGTILGILGSSINNYFKMSELKKLVKDSSDMIVLGRLKNLVEDNENLLNTFKNTEKTLNDLVSFNTNTYNKKIDNLFHKINLSLINIENQLSAAKLVKMENDWSKFPVKKNLSNPSEMETITCNMENQLKHTNLILYVLIFFTIVMPIITKS